MKFKKIKIIIISISIMILLGYDITKDQAGIVYGKKNSPIEIVNYTSFQCSGCTTMHEELGDTIQKYINLGNVKFIEKQIDVKRFQFDEIIYKHLTDKQMQDFQQLSKIYEKQNEWISMKSPEEVIEFLELSETENKKNVKDMKKILDEKNKLELKQVPTMFINGEKVQSNISKEEFEEKINSLIKNK